MELCPFVPSRSTPEDVRINLGEDCFVEEYRVMCLEAEVFERLCDLYPKTAESLKI